MIYVQISLCFSVHHGDTPTIHTRVQTPIQSKILPFFEVEYWGFYVRHGAFRHEALPETCCFLLFLSLYKEFFI